MARGKQPTPEMQQQAMQTVNAWMSALLKTVREYSRLICSGVSYLLFWPPDFAGFIFREILNRLFYYPGYLVLSSFDLMRRKKISE